jgi:hypothetical protein
MNNIIHNFYPQTGCKFDLEFNILNNFEYKKFNFLNANNNLSLTLESGKIKDHDNNFICSFNKVGPVKLSGNLSNDNFNFFINNHLIYNNYQNYDLCSGIEILSSREDLDDIKIKIYGDKPVYHITNDKKVYSEDVIKLYISGDQNNIGNFKIYQLDIGGTIDKNLGSFSYVPRDFFQISGNTTWQNGLVVESGQLLEFNILQKFVFFTNGTTYIPIYIDTDFGTIYKRLFVEIISRGNLEKINLNFISIPGVGTSSSRESMDYTTAGPDGGLNPNEGLGVVEYPADYRFHDHIKFAGNISVQSPKQRENDFYIYISGLSGNNYMANNFADTFTGSWIVESPSLVFEPKKLSTGFVMFDNTNNLNYSKNKSGIYFDFLKNQSNTITGISGILDTQIPIDSGYFRGLVFSVPYEYNKRWNITGIDFAIYKTGLFVTHESRILSGANLSLSLYKIIGNNFVLQNKIKEYKFLANNVYKTTRDEFNVYSLTGFFDVYPNTKYAIVLSGYSSGHLDGYKLFLPTGNSNYLQQDMIYETGIYGPSEYINVFPPGTDNKIPFIRLKSEKISDENIFHSNEKIELPASNSFNLNIFKIYKYYDDDSFTGSALLYVSGYSGLQASGVLSVFKNEFREITSSFNQL